MGRRLCKDGYFFDLSPGLMIVVANMDIFQRRQETTNQGVSARRNKQTKCMNYSPLATTCDLQAYQLSIFW
eukprot:m.140131 g.140131  ORF g.140131 m.140131 type:complete len:71 (-) comp15958_c5_seq8:2634-2846(-)